MKKLISGLAKIFTDIDCGYCRKLHKEVPELNRLGVAVRYLAYPRAGIGSISYDKAVSAWEMQFLQGKRQFLPGSLQLRTSGSPSFTRGEGARSFPGQNVLPPFHEKVQVFWPSDPNPYSLSYFC